MSLNSIPQLLHRSTIKLGDIREECLVNMHLHPTTRKTTEKFISMLDTYCKNRKIFSHITLADHGIIREFNSTDNVNIKRSFGFKAINKGDSIVDLQIMSPKDNAKNFISDISTTRLSYFLSIIDQIKKTGNPIEIEHMLQRVGKSMEEICLYDIISQFYLQYRWKFDLMSLNQTYIDHIMPIQRKTKYPKFFIDDVLERLQGENISLANINRNTFMHLENKKIKSFLYNKNTNKEFFERAKELCKFFYYGSGQGILEDMPIRSDQRSKESFVWFYTI